jgi:hypothetical protein
LISLLILESFEVQKIEDTRFTFNNRTTRKTRMYFYLDLVSNGYMNPIELQHFPMNGKKCLLKLVRRRWKDKNNLSSSCHNSYFFAQKGAKSTPDFWAFLKETGL